MRLEIDGRQVSVLDPLCRYRSCLRVGHYVHRSAAGASGCSSWTDARPSCVTRDSHGCPPADQRELVPKLAHAAGCPGPRYSWAIKSDRGRIRCRACGELIPRFLARQELGGG